MSHSRSQSRPPPKNPLPARVFRGAFVISVRALPDYLISYISLTSTFRFYNLVREARSLPPGHKTECLVEWNNVQRGTLFALPGW